MATPVIQTSRLQNDTPQTNNMITDNINRLVLSVSRWSEWLHTLKAFEQLTGLNGFVLFLCNVRGLRLLKVLTDHCMRMWYWILKHDTFWVLNAQHVSVQCVRPPLTFQSGSYYLQGNSVIIVFTVFRDIFLYCCQCFSVWTFFISVTYHISTPPLNPPPPPHTNIPINRWHTTYVSLARSSRGSRMSVCADC